MSSFPQVWGVWSVNTANLGITLHSLGWVDVGSGVCGSVQPPGRCTLQDYRQCQGLQACIQGGWNMRMSPPAPKKHPSQASDSVLRFFYNTLQRRCLVQSVFRSQAGGCCRRAVGCRQCKRGGNQYLLWSCKQFLLGTGTQINFLLFSLPVLAKSDSVQKY